MKKLRSTPISRKLLFPMVILIAIEILLLVGGIFGGGLIQHLEGNEKDILRERVINRKNYLENEMITRWSNVSETVQKVNNTAERLLWSGQISLDTLDDGSDYSTPLLADVSDDLISLMRTNRVTGAFVILNTDDLEALHAQGIYENKPGLYFRDYDPVSNSTERNQDLLLEYAPTEVVQNLNISLDSEWRPQFEFERAGGYGSYLYEPFEAAVQIEEPQNLEISDLGYWSEPYCLYGDGKEVISYSVPLILSDGTVYGVLGIDLTLDYLKSLIPYSEIGEKNQGAYLLGSEKNDDGKLTNVLINGPVYAQMADDQEITEVYEQDGEMAIRSDGQQQMYCDMEYLNLYNTNTPFSSQKWALVGTVSRNNLFAFSNQIITTLIKAILLTLAAGVAGGILISLFISRPVTMLTRSVKKAKPSGQMVLAKTGIREIDLLAESLENLSGEMLYAAEKFAYIINMASIQLSVFEVNRKDGSIFITEKFFSMFDIPEMEPSEITIDSFRDTMLSLESCRQNDMEGENGEILYKIPSEGDSYGPFRYIKVTLSDNGQRCIGLVEDVTSAVMEKEAIEHERDHDLLTGLLNRRAFNRIMKHLFSKGSGVLKTAALVMMDLDDLKYVNDTYGHDYGDKYIQSAAECFQESVPEDAVVSRFSGDEFYIFLYGYPDKEEVRGRLAELKRGIKKKNLSLPDQEPCHIRVSGGVAWYPEDSTSYEQLLRYSDFAMYKVKHSVKGEFSDFDLGVYNHDVYLMQNKAELNELLEKRAVEYYFQPIVSTATGEIYAYEALMRAHMTTLQNPAEILQLARMESKLNQIESMTWFKSMEAFSGWIEKGRVSEACRIFINSVPNLVLPSDQLDQFEKRYQPYLKNIVLEITEEEEQDEESSGLKKALMKRWRGEMALDDYGSGYNSEKALLGLSPRYIKVDYAIIRDIHLDRDKQKILENIVSYAHERNQQIIAEGIETMEEAVAVIQMNVDYLQGFLLAKPALLPPEISADMKRLIQAEAAKKRH
ncbi:EAL domain-containing protein [Lachnospiraceae bacterium OF09-33XD]|nr:EAL domain-containing protein [Lachnospiraceae bacterium OF09-33XD]